VNYDAIIIGGGPAGATAALLLARAGWSVAVLEKEIFPRRKVCGEFLSATNFPLLEELGIVEAFRAAAGPEVREIGLFAGRTQLKARIPRMRDAELSWGQALGREQLDTLLLKRAQQLGATLWQPWKAVTLTLSPIQNNEDYNGYSCVVKHSDTGENRELRAQIRAHLPPALMPLLVFPGGYGGMVATDGGRVSLSCCIRRDQLSALRKMAPQSKAADAVLQHVRASCLGVDKALTGALRDGAWLSAGPIRPGIRNAPAAGIFLVGNAAGEAHPLIAEGISMAMQSAWLLCQMLLPGRLSGHSQLADKKFLQNVAKCYRAAWRRHFAARISRSSFFAYLAVHPWVTALILPLFRIVPSLLTLGAYLAGKTQRVTSVAQGKNAA